MHQGQKRLSMTFGRLHRNRETASTTSPKSTESSPRLENSSSNNAEPVTSPRSRQSVPASTINRPPGVQRVMTEPPRPLPTAVIARPRSLSHPPTPTAAVVSSSPVQTPTQRSTSSPKPQGRLRKLLNSINLKNRSNRKPSKSGKRQNLGLVFALLVFCITAVIYISLAFSLQNFPSFTHICFIGLLFVEFSFVIRYLLKHAKRTRRDIRNNTPMQEGPPAGAIIHGASNWDGLPDDQHPEGFNLEEIGTTEALKPIPPAYGHYRGSVRIADSDIRWVRRNETTEVPRIEETTETTETTEGVVRPPSYASEGGAIV